MSPLNIDNGKNSYPLTTTHQLLDEAEPLGFERLFFTGGEPFILDDVYEKLAYASNHFPTTVLTNAMLFSGKRLQKLRSIANDNLSIQISLDGA